MHQNMLGADRPHCRFAEVSLREAWQAKIPMTQQCALGATKDHGVNACMRRAVGSQVKGCNSSLCSALVGPHLEYCGQCWAPHFEGHSDILQRAQQTATEMMEGLEHFPSEERLREV